MVMLGERQYVMKDKADHMIQCENSQVCAKDIMNYPRKFIVTFNPRVT